MAEKTNGKSAAQEEREEIAALIRTTPPGDLPPEARMMLEERKIKNRIAAAIAGMSWGKNLDLSSRVALAEWGRRNSVDVTQEVHILGDRLYLNAQFYLNRLQSLIRSGAVEYLLAEHVHVDKRLDASDPTDAKEIRRRRDLRIQYNIPDAAVGAVVARLKLRNVEEEFSGAKWCGGGTRKNDPVGDAMPVETAETRAYRRVCKLVVSHIPQLQKDVDRADDDAALNVTAVISESKAREREQREEVAARRLNSGRVIDGTQGYGESTDASPVAVAVEEDVPSSEELENREFQDDRALMNH
jgi:hypothetical protein